MQPAHKKLILAYDAKRLFNNFTGLGNYSRSLVKNLQHFFPEHEYHLFTPKAVHNEETAYFFDTDKFTIHTPSSKKPLWRTFGMANDINTLKPDIFHGLSHEIPFGIHSDTTTVVTFHDLIYEIFPKQFGIWDRVVYQLKYRSTAKRVHYIAAISQSTQSDLLNLYNLDPDKIEVLYQSCNDAFFREQHINTDTFPLDIKNYYLYVGSIIERKGLLNIIEAYAQLPEIYQNHLVVVGNGDKKYLDKVLNRIKFHQLENHVTFIHSMNNEQIIQIYDNSLCLIYPSIYEGFGIPVIESLLRKKPVITSNISSLPEAAGPGAILLNPYDIDALVEAMKAIHEHDVYNALSINGFEYVLQSFSPQRTSEQVHQFYQQLLK